MARAVSRVSPPANRSCFAEIWKKQNAACLGDVSVNPSFYCDTSSRRKVFWRREELQRRWEGEPKGQVEGSMVDLWSGGKAFVSCISAVYLYLNVKGKNAHIIKRCTFFIFFMASNAIASFLKPLKA